MKCFGDRMIDRVWRSLYSRFCIVTFDCLSMLTESFVFCERNSKRQREYIAVHLSHFHSPCLSCHEFSLCFHSAVNY